jgi:hypothetical protein
LQENEGFHPFQGFLVYGQRFQVFNAVESVLSEYFDRIVGENELVYAQAVEWGSWCAFECKIPKF